MKRILSKLYSLNTIKIAVDDIKLLSRNTIAIIVIIGLIIVPSLYAWFNIAAGWDPYKNTNNLKLAIANNDAGYEDGILPVPVNVGDMVISEVRNNSDFKWVVTGEAEALESVTSGKYYAAIIIPDNFSKNILSLFGEKPEKSAIKYYSNEKTNAIAPLIIDKEATALQSAVEEEFVTMVVDVAFNLLNDIVNADNGNINVLVNNLEDNLSAMETDVKLAAQTMSSLADSLDTIDTLVNTGAVAACAKQIEQYKVTLKKLEPYLSESVKKDINNINVKKDNLKTATQSEYSRISKDMNDASRSLLDTASDISELKKEIKAVGKDSDISELRSIMSQGERDIAAFLAQPVALDTISMYPIANNGSAMAPFYTCLSLWVGGTIMAALIKVELEEKRRKNLLKFRYYQEYFGRGVLFFLIGLMQALVVLSGDLWYLGIDCKHPGYFVLAGVIAGAVFVNLIYTFTTSFGDVGKAICVFLLVVQVAGSGGTLPIELMPRFFKAVNPLMPFTHALAAMREAIYGFYGNIFWKELGLLGSYVAFSLFLGLFLRLPVLRMNRFFKNKLEETKVM